MDHRDIFVSHAEEDGEIALGLARELHAQGQSTWIYEEDAVPGISHLIQSSEAIETCRTFLLIATTKSVQSPEVIREVEQAHQLRKVIIPVRLGLTQEQFTASSRILRMATGTTVTLSAEANDLKSVATRIARSLLVGERTDPGLIRTEPAELKSHQDASERVAMPRQNIRVPSYALALTAASIVAALVLFVFLTRHEPVTALKTESPPVSPVIPALTTNDELIELLEMRAETILEMMDDDLRETSAQMQEVIGQPDSEEKIKQLTEQIHTQRQRFIALHRRHVAALKANKPILAHEILAEIYQNLSEPIFYQNVPFSFWLVEKTDRLKTKREQLDRLD